MSTPARGQIQTIRGAIAPAQLGLTLPHEHIFIRMWEIAGRFDYAGQVLDERLLAEEIAAFKQLGGRSLVELTLRGLGRDPLRLRAFGERTGVQIVMGCGWYREPYYPPADQIDRRRVDSLAEELIHEILEGAPGSPGVLPGIIGEIGTEKDWVSAQEERVHRAAARAQKATGLALTTHSIGADVGLEQLALFEEEGVDPARVVIGHCDLPASLSLSYHLGILERGAFVEFDTFGSKGEPMEELALGMLLELLSRGHEQQILLSHDVCKYPHLRRMGGQGFTYVIDTLLPRLRAEGVSEATIDTLTVANPRRLLTIV
jgi:predicted metal-dependent phosphotriesterase family hydrolase